MPKLMTLTAKDAGLVPISSSLDWEQRIEQRVKNIELCCDAVEQSILFLGVQLAACKWSGEFIIDSVWTDEDESRSWTEWLKRRDFKFATTSGQTKVDHKNAAALMAWASCCATISEANADREIPLPLPNSPSQLTPYLSTLERVDDWEPEDWPERKGDVKSPFQTEPPYAEKQPAFLQKWEAVYNQVPPEKRLDKKGNPKPPARSASADYIRTEREILEGPTPAQHDPNHPPIVNLGQKPTTAERMEAAAEKRKKVVPAPGSKKTKRELEEEKREYQLQQDAREYRLCLMSCQSAANALRAKLVTILYRNHNEHQTGSEYLDKMRDLDLGSLSVTNDMELLGDVVNELQEAYRLAMEEFVPAEPIDIPEFIDGQVVEDTTAKELVTT